MHIIIDGYNFIGKYSGMIGDIEEKREALINLLFEYRALKKHDITVVFDGWQNGMPNESSEVKRGVRIVFSRLGEKADDVIKRLSVKGQNIIVVSSDREVSSYAVNRGAVSLSCSEFEKKLTELAYYKQNDINKVEEISSSCFASTKKKGNPRRLSKEERRKRVRISKM